MGSPDPARGHIVHAFIVTADGHRGAEGLTRELQTYVKDRYSLFAYPRRITFVSDLPRSTTHKIQREELRRRALIRDIGGPANHVTTPPPTTAGAQMHDGGTP